MLETSEQRNILLKAGFSGKEIEKLYLRLNNIKTISLPILCDPAEFNGSGMENLGAAQPDRKNCEIAGILISLGLSRNAAMTLSYLQDTNSARSIDLETATRLRQPRVSLAVRQLKERDWITEREEKKPGKGRPNKIYSLKLGFGDIIAQLEADQKKVIDEAEARIGRLKELGRY